MHELSRTDARRIAVRAQLLDDPAPTDLVDVVRRLTLLQADATNTIAPSADLVAWSRLGSSYRPEHLAEALRDGTFIELRGMIRPAEDLALFRAEMAAWPGTGDVPSWRRYQNEWVEANGAFRRDILAWLDDNGPSTSREIPDTSTVAWRSSGWNSKRNVAMMIEFLVERGEVATAGRQGRDRLWDLASRVYPHNDVVAAPEALRRRNERRLRALGIVRGRGPECPVEPNDVGAAGEPAVIDGVKGTWRVDPTLLDQPFSGRTVLLSPLDRLVFDRKRMTELLEFDYQLEMYKPVAKRRWGYFALPILSGDELVGKLDATVDREEGALRVRAIHEDEAFSPTLAAAVNDEVAGLASWLGVDLAWPGGR